MRGRLEKALAGEDDHRSACELFDSLDLTLSSSVLAAAQSFVEAGIDPSFDAQSLVTYAEVGAESPEERELYFKAWHDDNDRHQNMDY